MRLLVCEEKGEYVVLRRVDKIKVVERDGMQDRDKDRDRDRDRMRKEERDRDG